MLLHRWIGRGIQKARLFRREHLWFRGMIKKGDLVLDVGSGFNPCIRANVLCEKFALDDAERAGKLVADRPLVLGDVECLPFRDQSFDFVVCSQVLEHVFHPERAAAEMQRVGKRGRIETPGYFSEMIAGEPFHLWYTYVENEVLHFKEKRRPIHDEELAAIVNQLKQSRDPAFDAFVFEHLELFVTIYDWVETMELCVEPINDGMASSESEEKAVATPEDIERLFSICAEVEWSIPPPWKWRTSRDVKFWLKSILSKPYRRSVNLWNVVACPSCRGRLEKKDEQSILCRNCQSLYPLFGSVPGLLMEYRQRVLF